ncbi:ABC transporter ATP-binding protein [candidate division WOR_3 bacterium SM23_42]|uniref:ABC transporter ATP-binding protein n=1 Tax=candidate division WOR_3 bacterium SM23_42 TaxID=1703779 RepID=A0A0S8FVI6_UNCW3|nr:MAG: ABC transporter ATP-binding protein [candidate division WOR_3 bacterium SM23_42]
MGAPEISNLALFFCFLLLLIPLFLSVIFRLKLVGTVLNSVVRMSIQLLLIGIFLKYLFDVDKPIITVAWLLVMITVAVFTVIRKNSLSVKKFLLPTLISFVLATFLVLYYFNELVVDLARVVEAKYTIAIGGMLLGNALSGNIIGTGNFYQRLKRDEDRYLYVLSAGATRMEALFPYFRESIASALKPTIANMATMGIVFLPGMMTGQIIGGSSPLLAIKYQLAIMIAIFTASTISVTFTILFTMRTCFNPYGTMRRDIFRTGS